MGKLQPRQCAPNTEETDNLRPHNLADSQCLPTHCCQPREGNPNQNRQVFSLGVSVILFCLERKNIAISMNVHIALHTFKPEVHLEHK